MPETYDFSATFNESFRDVINLIECPPALDFEKAPLSRIDYAFPRIRPRERGVPATLWGELNTFYESATRKYFYHDFFDAKKGDELSWPDEMLCLRKGGHSIERVKKSELGKFINFNRSTSLVWFESAIIEYVTRSQQPTCTFVLGQPGSGKSTLLKFLINATREKTKKANVVFSRFESIKFFRFVRSKPPRWRAAVTTMAAVGDLPESMTQTVELLSDYIFSVVLRDLLLNSEYTTGNGLEPALDCKLIGNRNAIETLVYSASEGVIGVTEESCQQAFHILWDSLSRNKFDHKRLFEIDFKLRYSLVRILSENTKVCIIFDGLDFLSPEDEDLDAEKYTFLKVIMAMFGLGTVGRGITIDLGFDHHAIIVLRHNTFYRLMDKVDTEVKSQLLRVFEVGALQPAVVFYRGIFRGLKELEGYEDVPNNRIASTAQKLFKGLDIILRSLDIKFGTGKTSYEILELFNGNFRDCFDFVGRLLYWVADESANIGSFGPQPRVADIVQFISSGRARRVLRQRGYRIIELLLFFQTTTFQNAISVDVIRVSAGPESKVFIDPIRMTKNTSCKGLIDNVFNYHCADHDNRNCNHLILEKIRLLQICNENDHISHSAMLRELGLMGYTAVPSSEVERCITILRHDGFLNRIDEGGERFYAISRKGRFVIERMLFNNIYIEHVYHKTMLPLRLIPSQYDAPRSEGHDRWTIASIRNCFIFLSYVSFVENSGASGSEIPEKFKVTVKLRVAVVDAIKRILIQDYLEKRGKSPATWFVNLALQAIQEQVGRWHSEGLIAPRS